jgi:hypothetical protein
LLSVIDEAFFRVDLQNEKRKVKMIRLAKSVLDK